MKKMVILVGNYGSGKTEIAINLAGIRSDSDSFLRESWSRR